MPTPTPTPNPSPNPNQVTDAESKALVGFFYTDLHPREGKYGHAACFGLQPACELGGVWQPPVAACVCNFPKPSTEKPALLSHRDVEILPCNHNPSPDLTQA